ncbi:hypothetical protein QQF64_007952, partial [Cirrhinus molitorella]
MEESTAAEHEEEDTTLITVNHSQSGFKCFPQKWLTEGDPVTLVCKVYSFSTGWTFSWFTLTVSPENSRHYNLLSDSSRGAGGNYTVSSAALNHTGVYVCRAEREKSVFKTQYSNTQPLWVTKRPKPKVTIKPAQHVFRGDTVTLRCDIYGKRVSRSHWFKNGVAMFFSDQEHTFNSVNESDAGKYSCFGSEGSHWSKMSDAVTLTVSGLPKPTLTMWPQSSMFTGDSVTLRCEVIQPQNGWVFLWRKNSNSESTGATTKTINSVKVSDGGEYSCRAQRRGYYTDYSEPIIVTIYERPKPKVTIKPGQHVFRGDTVTLRCDIYGKGVTSWLYSWYKEGSTRFVSNLPEHTFSSVTESDAGKYSCKGTETEGSRWSQISDAVTLTVSV